MYSLVFDIFYFQSGFGKYRAKLNISSKTCNIMSNLLFLYRYSDILKMANEQRLISGIEYKVRKLIEFNDELNKENAELHQKIDALNSNVAALTKELEVKRNELFKISLADTIESELGVEEGKERLDSLIEEID